MTSEQAILLQTSWERVKPKASQLAEFFYYHLFDKHPEFRVMFKGSFYEQQKKFIAMLDMVILNINQVSVVENKLAESGQRHKGYGVKPEDYAPVGEALLYALKTALNDEWTQKHTDAWTAAYQLMAQRMLSA